MTSTWLIIYEVVYSCINVSLVHKRVHTVRTRRYQDGCSLAKICLSSIIVMFQEDRLPSSQNYEKAECTLLPKVKTFLIVIFSVTYRAFASVTVALSWIFMW